MLAGGCFWGMQLVFEQLKGVDRVVAGYAGGNAATAQYETVSTGATGHAESVEITYDPGQDFVQELLDVYFKVAHDPTELNRQGPDEGTQYRSEIFYTTGEQRTQALAHDRASGADARLFLAGRDDRRAVTRILCGRGLPSRFRAAQSAQSVHRLQRSAEAARSYVSDFPQLDQAERL